MPGELTVLRPAGVVLLLLLVACGGGSEPTDEQRVEAALLRLSDFPADEGWETQPTATTDPAEADFEAALEDCEERLDPTVETRSADRDSDGFVRGDTIQAMSNASVVAEADVRDELFGALESMVDCFGTALQDALVAQAGGKLEVAVSEPYSIDVVTDAERTAGNAIQLSIQPDTVFIDVVTIEQGPTLLFAAFLHEGELTFDDEEQILAPAVERLKVL